MVYCFNKQFVYFSKCENYFLAIETENHLVRKIRSHKFGILPKGYRKLGKSVTLESLMEFFLNGAELSVNSGNPVEVFLNYS